MNILRLRSLMLVLCALFISTSVYANWTDSKIAVFDVRTRVQFDDINEQDLTGEILKSLKSEKSFQFITGEDLGLTVDLKENYTQEKALEAAGKAGAAKALLSSVYEINDKYYLLIKGLDVKTQEQDFREYVSAENEQELLDLVPELMEIVLSHMDNRLADAENEEQKPVKKKVRFKEKFQISQHVKAGVFYQDGHSLYKIGGLIKNLATGDFGNIGYDISQLKFPLSTEMIQIQYNLDVSPRISLEFKLSKNVPFHLAGRMEDSDWGMWYLQGAPWGDYYTLDVFSLSDASLDQWRGGAECEFLFPKLKPFLLNLHVGLDYYYAHWSMTNLDQWYPSYETYKNYLDPSYGGHDLLQSTEPGLIYSFHKFAVLGGVELGLDLDWLTLSSKTSVLISIVADRDDHVLRSKLSEGVMMAIGVRETLLASYKFLPRWSLILSGSGEYCIGSGTQIQSFYENTTDNIISDKISIQESYELADWTAGLSIGYQF